MIVWHKLRPLQAMAAALFFKHRRLLLSLPRQYGGKTELGCQLGIDLISRPSSQAVTGIFLAKDKNSAKKATREKYDRICDKKLFEVNTHQIYLKKQKTNTIFIDSVDKDPDRIRGGTYSFVHWSEVAFSKIEKGETLITVFDKIVQPTLALQDGYALLESTNNGKNAWYKLWEDYKTYGFHRLKISFSRMLEMGLVTQEQFDQIITTTHPDVFRQEYECEWVTFLGKVYPELKDRHIDKDMPFPEPWMQVIFAIDWGYHPSATCVLFGYVKGGVLHVFDEHYQMMEMPIATAEAIERRRLNYDITRMAGVGDHEPDRIAELTSRGIPCANADKTNTMGARMQIKEALYFDRLKIHPRCENLLKDLDAATWDSKKDGELDEKACTWGHFDGEATLRYLIRMLSNTEAVQPIKNPHLAVDSASAAAYNIRRLADAFKG